MNELYRKMWVSDWGTEAFRGLSDSAKLLLLRLVTGPECNAIPGVVVANKGQLADAFGWSPRRISNAFGELDRAGLAIADWKAGVIVLSDLLNREKPRTPNVIKSWGRHYGQVPACKLKEDVGRLLSEMIAGMSAGFREAMLGSFPGAVTETLSERDFPKGTFPIQEQEQNQEQKQEQEQTASPISPSTNLEVGDDLIPACQRPEVRRFEASWQPPPRPLPADWYPSEESRKLATKLGLSREELEKFTDHIRSKAKISADWDAEFRGWLRRAGQWAQEARAAASEPKVRSYAEAMAEGV